MTIPVPIEDGRRPWDRTDEGQNSPNKPPRRCTR
jgi:hypothetical protein